VYFVQYPSDGCLVAAYRDKRKKLSVSLCVFVHSQHVFVLVTNADSRAPSDGFEPDQCA
jgi:hypothetical protein